MNPVAFHAFGMQIYWYGIIIALSILVAVWVGAVLCKKLGYKEEIPFEVMLMVVPLGILGARLFYITFSGGEVTFAEFFDLRSGGIAIFGGIMAACLGVFIYTRFIRKSSFFAITDVLVICGILAQSIGRWGNYFNTEVYGLEVGFNFFPITIVAMGGTYHLALFFYESVLSLIGFFVLLKILSKQKNIGNVSAVYLIWYGTTRAILEPLRDSSFILEAGSLPISFIISLLAIAIGALILYLNHKGKIPQHRISLYKDTHKGEE